MVRWPGWPWERARKERKVVEVRGLEREEEGQEEGEEESLLPLWWDEQEVTSSWESSDSCSDNAVLCVALRLIRPAISFKYSCSTIPSIIFSRHICAFWRK